MPRRGPEGARETVHRVVRDPIVDVFRSVSECSSKIAKQIFNAPCQQTPIAVLGRTWLLLSSDDQSVTNNYARPRCRPFSGVNNHAVTLLHHADTVQQRTHLLPALLLLDKRVDQLATPPLSEEVAHAIAFYDRDLRNVFWR